MTAGSGSYAPRKRHAYTSKRLQQVVSEFRSEQAKAKTGTEQDSGPDSGDELDEGPAKKRAKKGGKGEEKANVKTVTSGKRGKGGKGLRGSRGSSSAGSRKRTINKHANDGSASDYGGTNNGETPEGTPPPLAVHLRPRPKPAYKAKA